MRFEVSRTVSLYFRQGKTVIGGTRIGVHDVVGLLLNGASVEDLSRWRPLWRSQPNYF